MQNSLVKIDYVRELIPVHKVTITRWLNGYYDSRKKKQVPPLESFPKPKTIRGRHYWSKAAIDAFAENFSTDGETMH